MKTLIFSLLFVLIGNLCFAQSRKVIDSLKHEISIAKEDTNQVRLLARLGGIYRLNALDSALIYTQKSLTLAEKIDDNLGIARGQNAMCVTLTRAGSYPLALEYGFKGLAGFEKLKDTLGIVLNLAGICLCFREQGDNKNAIKYGVKALKLIELFGAHPNRINSSEIKMRIVNISGTLSAAYEKDNQLDSALKYGVRAYESRKDWSGILYVLGNTYLKKEQYDKALHYFKLGLPASIKTNFQKDKLEILTGISNVFIQKGVLDSAISYSKQVLADQYGKFYPASLLVASSQLASIYETQKKTDSAFKYLKQAISLKDTLFNQGKTIAVQSLIFKEDQKKKELEDAELKFQNRLKIYGLMSGLTVLALVVLLLWRNNQHKQRAYELLRDQKKETDKQRDKAEKALTELKSTQAQLIQSEKLASLGELTAGIAHEIQNPLNFVNNFSELSVELVSELLEERNKEYGLRDEALEKDLLNDLAQNQEKINLHGKRASSIVKGMLEHSRASTGVKELTDINKLADEYLRLAYHGLRAKDSTFNSDFKTDFDENLPKIEVIPQDLGRVLLNIINNAFYATQQRFRPLQGDKAVYLPKITVSTKAIDNQIIIKVKDNGIGMTEATKAKVFQPFFTTKPTGQGTGLGLSLAYDIVTKGHGGTIECESVEGEGTTFTVKLPLST